MSYQEVYRDGKVHVLAERCATCIFRPGNLMQLQPGRVKGMVDECSEEEGVIPCHSTIYRDDVRPAICRGFFESRTGRNNSLLQLAERLGIVEDDPTPPKGGAMSRRQFARKVRPPAERNLHLVPPQKPKRRPKWKVGRIRKRKYEHQRELHAYEDALILAAIRELGNSASADWLHRQWPGRFGGGLIRTLRRMVKDGRLNGPRHYGNQYSMFHIRREETDGKRT